MKILPWNEAQILSCIDPNRHYERVTKLTDAQVTNIVNTTSWVMAFLGVRRNLVPFKLSISVAKYCNGCTVVADTNGDCSVFNSNDGCEREVDVRILEYCMGTMDFINSSSSVTHYELEIEHLMDRYTINGHPMLLLDDNRYTSDFHTLQQHTTIVNAARSAKNEFVHGPMSTRTICMLQHRLLRAGVDRCNIGDIKVYDNGEIYVKLNVQIS